MLKRFGLAVVGAGMVLGGFASAGQASAAGFTPVTINGADATRHLEVPPTLCHASVSVPMVQVPVQQVLDQGAPNRCANAQGS